MCPPIASTRVESIWSPTTTVPIQETRAGSTVRARDSIQASAPPWTKHGQSRPTRTLPGPAGVAGGPGWSVAEAGDSWVADTRADRIGSAGGSGTGNRPVAPVLRTT